MLFTEESIGNMRIKNRFVRSATADAELEGGKVTDSTIDRYGILARENVGMIITGDFPVVSLEMIGQRSYDYQRIRVGDVQRIAAQVHQVSHDCKIIAQLSTENIYFVPSTYNSPWGMDGMHICDRDEILFIEECFIETALMMQAEGYDGVQLHAAHGGFLSMFLSPYANHRTDDYGGSTENRCRIVANIVRGIKARMSELPVLIKINATEYLDEGMDPISLQETVTILEKAGIDAIEYSGGLWEAMTLSDEVLGFPSVPALESHTQIASLEKQSYFRDLVKDIVTNIPIILVGGNRNCRLMESILQEGGADFMALCRPLICEPDLISKWMAEPTYTPRCVNCNACIYDMFLHPWEKVSSGVKCLYSLGLGSALWKERYRDGLRWVKEWRRENMPL